MYIYGTFLVRECAADPLGESVAHGMPTESILKADLASNGYARRYRGFSSSWQRN